ncbi:AMP-binding protein [Bradyrhizobium tropiciagri]|uniref:AMP-binding protein n=1 Tax=Bradyrhizobium tropiciagri TaxID=312253 RepID=UPI00067E436D|nr:AMP-binding protein [Bradyrhizobium tropiciagri]
MSACAVTQAEKQRHYLQTGDWANETLLDYFDSAVSRDPGKTAIVAPDGVRLTYGELAEQVDRAAFGLASAGISKGDVVSLQLPNCAEFIVLHLAATRLGAITNPLLPNYRAKELGYILKCAGTKVLVTMQNYRGFAFDAMYADLWPNLPNLSKIYVVGGSACEGMRPYDDILVRKGNLSDVGHDGNDITALIFTSGTESSPKGALHSHNTAMFSTKEMARLLNLTSDDVVWMPSPIAHGTGFEWGVRQAITVGGTLVLQDVWNTEDALRLIEAERCTFVLSATTFMTMLLESPSLGSHDLSSLRIFGCAGAPIPRVLGERARRDIGCTLIGMWGMTECFVGSASAPDMPDDKLWATDGRSVKGGELAIFDKSRSSILSPGDVGELATRGPHVALGYFNDPERTAATFRADGWLFTNDLAVMDEDGFIRIVGRMKEVINRGGLKISVREIEDLIADLPEVDQVALVPVPDARLGEKSCACIVLRQGQHAALSDIVRFLEQRGLAKYKLPEFVAFVDAFPMTPSGKIQRSKLRDDILAGLIDMHSS